MICTNKRFNIENLLQFEQQKYCIIQLKADNGGPLVCLGKDDLWYVVGVGSWSLSCDLPNIPNVFARVSVFNSFLHDTIRRTEGEFFLQNLKVLNIFCVCFH